MSPLKPALPLAHYPCTDVGNGERLVALHGRDLRWIPRWKTWLVWDGRRWARDETGEVERRAKGVVRRMFADAAALSGDDRQQLAQHAFRSEAVGRLDAMTRLARSEPGIAISHEQLDQRPMLLTVRNGTLNLQTGTLGPHTRGDLATKLVDIDYDPAATCPVWLRTLDTIFAGDASLIEYVQRAVGYSLSGDTREQVLHLCHGTGANGKSTLLDVFGLLAGEYGQQADFTTFLERRTDAGPRNDVARLAGARLVRSSEVGENKRLNEGLIKSLTGGDVMTARFLYSEDFEFKPQFKLWLAANHKPVIRGTDYAIWRRVRLIPFEVTIAPEQRDDSLPHKLRAELPGILAWAVAGCARWLEQGLSAPDRVLAATQAYREESDTIGAFIADRCEVGAFEVVAGELYRAYEQWARENGEYSISAQMFGRRMSERGFDLRKGMKSNFRMGLRLRFPDDDPSTRDGYCVDG
jgi:putative DNA primase/helicase